MNRSIFLSLATILALSALGQRELQAVPLNIDISVTGGLVQSGYLGHEQASNNASPQTVLYPNDELAGIGESVSVTTQAAHYRNRSAIGSGPFVSMSNLLRDNMLIVNGEPPMSITLSGLLPAVYEMTTYHHDSQFGNGTARLEFLLTDGLVTNQSILTDVPTSGSTNPTSISTQTFQFTVLDDSPVVLSFVGSNFTLDPADLAAVSGFDLAFFSALPQPVPEPTSATLFGMGGLILLCVKRTRRRRKLATA